jgi:hypothetical protein
MPWIPHKSLQLPSIATRRMLSAALLLEELFGLLLCELLLV